jgi:hypothetical protein
VLLAGALRAMVCVRTEVPGRDAASYLWMAENAAAGDLGALFATVFHPLHAAVIAVVIAVLPGHDPVLAGQIASAGAATLAVVPLWRMTRVLAGQRAANWAGFAYAISAWFARHPAECMSEGLFYLLTASAMWWVIRKPGRPVLAGAAAAAAWLTRPEGAVLVALLPVWLWGRLKPRSSIRFAVAALPIALLLPLGFWWCGLGWLLTPKLAFNYDVGVGGAESASGWWLWQFARLPGHALEEFGWLWLPIALVGVALLPPRRFSDPATLLLLPLAVQCVVVPLLFSHPRFLSGPGVLLFPFAGIGAAALRERLRGVHPGWAVAALVALLASEIRIAAVRNGDRAIERELGHWLRAQLAPGEVVVSDMPRLCFYAGCRPPPPRPLSKEELLRAAGERNCRFASFVTGRTPVDSADLRALGLEPMEVPALLSAAAGSDRVLLFERPRKR